MECIIIIDIVKSWNINLFVVVLSIFDDDIIQSTKKKQNIKLCISNILPHFI